MEAAHEILKLSHSFYLWIVAKHNNNQILSWAKLRLTICYQPLSAIGSYPALSAEKGMVHLQPAFGDHDAV